MSYENFDPNDLLIQAFSTKPSGFVHRIPHGIRAIHLPTGTVVTCDTDRSQHRNRHLALTELWEQVQGKATYQELLAERDALAAEMAALCAFRDEVVGVMNNSEGVWGWHKNHTIATWDELFPTVPDAESPQHHLIELRADTAEKYYYMGWEHSLSTKADDGDHYGCGKRLAKSFADSIRRGEVE